MSNWNDDIIEDFTQLEYRINTNSIIKDAIEKILETHMVNGGWKWIELNNNLKPSIGNMKMPFTYYLYNLPDEDNYLYNELIDGGLSKEFVDWIIKLALIYGPNLWNSFISEKSYRDWKNLIPKYVTSNEGSELNITIIRYDGKQLVLEGNRYSYLNFIAELANLLSVFSEPLEDNETELIDQMINDLLSFKKLKLTESEAEESEHAKKET